jgi:hypothetical protein
MTVRHVVMFRRRPEIAEQPDVADDLTRQLAELPEKVPGLDRWVVAANEHGRPLCWDYVLEAELDDTDALTAYLTHPVHQALLPDLRAYFELAVVDYEPGRSHG